VCGRIAQSELEESVVWARKSLSQYSPPVAAPAGKPMPASAEREDHAHQLY
jgi:hypothetical protein